MADSNITKRALAAALKELMDEMPFEKINVAQICERCGMNRKSFYYHFKDKNDLVNWIFDADFLTFTRVLTNEINFNVRMEVLKEICCYFYDNRKFYCKALRIEGQNAFSEHFRECCLPLLKFRLVQVIGEDAADDFTVNFFADACLCAIERWILDKNCMPPEQFENRLKRLVRDGANALQNELTKE